VQDRDALAALAPDLAAHPALRLAWMDLGLGVSGIPCTGGRLNLSRPGPW
jgi:hypothetical protein